jgi:hypothetical protein
VPGDLTANSEMAGYQHSVKAIGVQTVAQRILLVKRVYNSATYEGQLSRQQCNQQVQSNSGVRASVDRVVQVLGRMGEQRRDSESHGQVATLVLVGTD